MKRSATRSAPGIAGVVGFLVCVELASGVLQGYYTPIFSDIARHLSIHDADVNWFEAAQLMVSALLVPLLARMGDLVGHRNVLLGSTAATALASWGVAFAPPSPPSWSRGRCRASTSSGYRWRSRSFTAAPGVTPRAPGSVPVCWLLPWSWV